MSRQIQKDFRKQLWRLDALSIGRTGYTVTKFRTEEWATGAVFVERFIRPNHCENLVYHEGFVVGVRGAVKELYSDIY